MWSLLLVGVLTAAPDHTNTAAVADLQSRVQTGTLLFSEGDCLAVKVFSGSCFTHVGAVVVTDQQVMVYDSMNGSGVRKQSLADYVRFLTPSDVQALTPTRPMTDTEREAFVHHLERQLGRPYRIRHYTTGKRCDGLHCAEYVTDALIAAGWFTALEPARVSPGSLWQGVQQSGRYVESGHYELREPIQPVMAREETWCQWSWRATKECCTATCKQMSRWFLCRTK